MNKKSKKRKSEPISASEAILGLLYNNQSPFRDQFQLWKLKQKWPEIVGPSIGSNTKPVSYFDSTLYVWVKSSSWMQELIFVAQPIKGKVNEFLKQAWAHQIRFTLDSKNLPGAYELTAAEEDFAKKIFDQEHNHEQE